MGKEFRRKGNEARQQQHSLHKTNLQSDSVSFLQILRFTVKWILQPGKILTRNQTKKWSYFKFIVTFRPRPYWTIWIAHNCRSFYKITWIHQIRDVSVPARHRYTLNEKQSEVRTLAMWILRGVKRICNFSLHLMSLAQTKSSEWSAGFPILMNIRQTTRTRMRTLAERKTAEHAPDER